MQGRLLHEAWPWGLEADRRKLGTRETSVGTQPTGRQARASFGHILHLSVHTLRQREQTATPFAHLDKGVSHVQRLLPAERGGHRLPTGDKGAAGEAAHQVRGVHLAQTPRCWPRPSLTVPFHPTRLPDITEPQPRSVSTAHYRNSGPGPGTAP